MNFPFTHRSKQHQDRVRAALDTGHANNASRSVTEPPAPTGTRAEFAQRVGVTDPAATDAQPLDALDALTAAKPAPVNAADVLYAAAWGAPEATAAPTQTRTTTEADALAVLAWGNDGRKA